MLLPLLMSPWLKVVTPTHSVYSWYVGLRVYVCAYTYQWLSICGEVVLWWTVSKTSLVSVLVPFVL